MLERAPDWRSFLQKGVNIGHMQAIIGHISTGRPLGNQNFIETIEDRTGRNLTKKKPGRKAKLPKIAAGTQ